MNEFSHLCKVVMGIESPRSQVTDAELKVLCRWAATADVVVEIGCFEGRSANALAHATDGNVFSIDLFRPGRTGISCSEWIARWGKLRGGSRNLTIVRGSSEAVAGGFDLPIDFLFIDADHTYDGVRRDWSLWMPKVRPGGIIALHDCRQTPNHPRLHGSGRFYQEDMPTMPGFEEIDGVESLAVFRKAEAVPPLSRVEMRVNPTAGPTLSNRAA